MELAYIPVLETGFYRFESCQGHQIMPMTTKELKAYNKGFDWALTEAMEFVRDWEKVMGLQTVKVSEVINLLTALRHPRPVEIVEKENAGVV
jgi:hypothetical protein